MARNSSKSTTPTILPPKPPVTDTRALLEWHRLFWRDAVMEDTGGAGGATGGAGEGGTGNGTGGTGDNSGGTGDNGTGTGNTGGQSGSLGPNGFRENTPITEFQPGELAAYYKFQEGKQQKARTEAERLRDEYKAELDRLKAGQSGSANPPALPPEIQQQLDALTNSAKAAQNAQRESALQAAAEKANKAFSGVIVAALRSNLQDIPVDDSMKADNAKASAMVEAFIKDHPELKAPVRPTVQGGLKGSNSETAPVTPTSFADAIRMQQEGTGS